jgi:hypothetical protein
MVRKGNSLVPWGAESDGVLSKMAFGKPLHVDVKQPRNSKHSALYWVLCHRIADAIGSESEAVSDLLKIETGHFTIIKSKKHGELKLPRSISFAKFGQEQFGEFFERCLTVISAEWGIARPDVLAAVSDIIAEKDAA